MFTERNQPHLRLVESQNLDRCSSNNLSAASPPGSLVRPYSMSLTEEGASPISPPISGNVIPIDRRSLTREAQVVMPNTLRESVTTSQRLPVAVFRENVAMPRPQNMPPDLDTVGKRVRWWRNHRKMSREDLAIQVHIKVSTLGDLENNRQKGSRKLHLIAAALRLNAHYLETGKGEPEAEYAQEAPQEPSWPFDNLPRSKLEKLNMIERRYLEDRLLDALSDIESERRKSKRTG